MTKCPICPRRCNLAEGQIGFCRGRQCINGTVEPINYGKFTSLALDPIEKKPLYYFYPQHYILSIGSFGCNLRCPFCQNYEISMAGQNDIAYRTVTPAELTDLALKLTTESQGNLGVAFTYNEPLISYEFVHDCCVLLKKVGLKTVLVSNGHINPEPLAELLPLIDAMNIDLKGFSESYYDYVGGNFECVKNTISSVHDKCHLEVTTLIVPTKNDDIELMEAEAEWLASLSPEIPLHISRYFPRYKCDIEATSVETIYQLRDIAQKYLRHVHIGNC